MQYDGSIKIDTRVNSKGLKKGIDNALNSSKKSFASVTKNIATQVEKAVNIVMVALKIIGILAAALVIIFGILAIATFKWAQKMTETLKKNLSTTSAFRDRVTQLSDSFNTLKGTFMALGATLLNALAPALLKVIDWLVKAVNWVSMFVAALTGQKTVMQYVSGAVNSAANATGKLAKNTKDAKKAAEGALAAFDEINVLQTETADEDTADTGSAEGGQVVMQEVAVPTDFVKSQWENFRDWFENNIINPIGSWLDEKIAKPVADWMIAAYKNVANPEWWKEQWEKIKVISITVWEAIKVAWASVTSWITEKWNQFNDWFKAKTQPLADWIKTKVTDPIQNWFKNTGDNISLFFSNAWNKVKGTWAGVGAWFQTYIIDPVRNAFSIALSSIRTTWETTFTGIKNFVKGIINTIIDFLNGMIRGITTGINTAIKALNSIKINMPSWLGGGSFGLNIPTVSTPQIPRLATGAVIPPNAEFAAILGDQKSGRNIEAPEGLIRQIIQEEIGNIQTDVKIEFGGSLGALVRELQPYIKKENTRIGGSLVKGTT